jgi:hypothetical protein
MSKRPAAFVLGTLGLLAACGHRADPLPPLRRSPPPLADFRLAQRGDALELLATAPKASVDGVAYETVGVEFLHATGLADLEKAGARQDVRATPGGRATLSLPLPAPGTLVRAAARAVSAGRRGPRTLTMALVAQPPVEAPFDLKATLGEDGIELAWKGVRPKEVPPPSLPRPPGMMARAGAAPALGKATAASPATTPPPPTPAAGARPAAPAQALTPEGPPASGAAAARSDEQKPGEPAAGEVKAGEGKPAAAPPPPKRRNGFFVYRRVRSGSYGAPLAGEPLDARKFEDGTATLGATWCYSVRAVASTEPLIESAPSDEVCLERRDVTPPAPPVGLAILPRPGGLELLWSPSGEEDLAGYRVFRAAGSAPPEKLAELPLGKASYLDATAVRGVVYRYTLTAFDQAGNESPPCEPVEATLP